MTSDEFWVVLFGVRSPAQVFEDAGFKFSNSNVVVLAQWVAEREDDLLLQGRTEQSRAAIDYALDARGITVLDGPCEVRAFNDTQNWLSAVYVVPAGYHVPRQSGNVRYYSSDRFAGLRAFPATGHEDSGRGLAFRWECRGDAIDRLRAARRASQPR